MTIPSVVLNGSTVNVGPTPTVIVPVTRSARARSLLLSLEQLAVGQVLNASVQVAPTALGPWDSLEDASFGDVSTQRTRTVSTARAMWLRVLGQQSGAGGNVKVYALLADEEVA